jgi:hypothetical protein
VSSLPQEATIGDVRAWSGGWHSDLVHRESAHTSNPVATMCGRVTLTEVEEIVEPGKNKPVDVDTPGVFVRGVAALTPKEGEDTRIERVTTCQRAACRPGTQTAVAAQTSLSPTQAVPPRRPRAPTTLRSQPTAFDPGIDELVFHVTQQVA